MPINVGTVEAVLQARDAMSPAMVAAAERVVVLTNALGNLGTQSVTTFNELNSELEAAEIRFNALTNSGTTAAEAMTAQQAAALSAANNLGAASTAAAGLATQTEAVGSSLKTTVVPALDKTSESLGGMSTSAAAAGQTMSGVEGIAQRLIERLIILWAVRGAADFVIDILKGADSLEKFSQQLDVSVGFLQQVQYASEKTDVPFNKMTSNLDTFQKKMAETSPQTVDALDAIGLKLSDTFGLSNEEKINKVIAAIATIPDHTTRVKAELALFGSDAIDPMIMKFQQLGDEFDKSGKKMSDSTVQALANTLNMYKGFYSEWAPVVGDIIDKLQQMVAASVDAASHMFFQQPGDSMTNRFLQGMTLGGPAAAAQMMFGAPPPSEAGKPQPIGIGVQYGPSQDQADAAKTGDALYASIQRQIAAYKELDPELIKHLENLKAEGELTEAVAASMGLTSVQYKYFIEQHKEGSAAYKAALAEEMSATQDLTKVWNAFASDLDSIGDRGLAAIHDKLDKGLAESIAQQDTMLARGKLNLVEYISAITAIYGDYLAKTANADSIFQQQQEDKQKGWQTKITEIDEHTAEVRASIGEQSLDRQEQSIADHITKQEWQWKAAYDKDQSLFLVYKDAIVALEEEKDAEIYAKTIEAYNKLDAATKLITGPIKGLEDIKPPPIHDWAIGFATDFGIISAGLRDMGQEVGGTFKTVVDQISAGTREVQNFERALEDYKKYQASIKQDPNNASPARTATTDLGVALAIGESGYSTYQASQAGGAAGIAGGALSGAATGFELGTIVPGIGNVLGAAIGAIAGAVMGIIHDIGQPSQGELQGRQIEGQFQNQFGTGTLTDMASQVGLIYQLVGKAPNAAADEIQAMLSAEANGADATKNAIAGIQQVLDSAGPLKYFADVIEQLQKVELHTADISTVTKLLDTNWQQMADAGTYSSGRISDGLRTIIQLNDTLGIQSKEIATWEKAQADTTVASYNAIADVLTSNMSQATQDAATKLNDVNAQIADLENKQKAGSITNVQKDQLQDDYQSRRLLTAQLAAAPPATQAGLDNISILLQGGLATAQSQGATRSQAIAAESTALTQLENEYKHLGIAITDATSKEMFMENDIQVAAPQLIKGVNGLASAIISLDNIQQETGDNFHAQQIAGYDSYVRIQGVVAALGGTTEDALRPMQTYLHAAADEAKKLNVPLDANTQELIEQSKQLGVWSDDTRTDSQKVHDDFTDLTKAIKDLTTALGLVPTALPDPTAGWDRHPHIQPVIDPAQGASDSGDPNAAANNVFHRGGVLAQSGAEFSHAGAVYAHSGIALGANEMNIVGERGEAMLNRSAVATIGPGTVHALNRGDASALSPNVQAFQFDRLSAAIENMHFRIESQLSKALYLAARDGYLGGGVRRQ